MAHNIEIRNGVASFAENGKKERAWHGLGDDQQIFDRPMFVHEALKACHADYTVQAQPVAALSPEVMEMIQNGQDVPFSLLQDLIVADKMATMRLDHNETLGLVSDKYGIVQNEDAFKFVDLFCSGQFAERDNTPVIETCGVLGKGERVFVTAKFPEKIVLDAKRDDLVDMYMTFTTSHDGTGAVRAMVTPVRVVCNNTLTMALSHNIGRVSFRHTSNVMNRLDLLNKENAEFAAKALNVYEVYKNGLEQAFDHLKNIKLSEKRNPHTLEEHLHRCEERNGGWHRTRPLGIWHCTLGTQRPHHLLSEHSQLQGCGNQVRQHHGRQCLQQGEQGIQPSHRSLKKKRQSPAEKQGILKIQ